MPTQRFVNRMQQTNLAELTCEIAQDVKPAASNAFRLESTAEGGLDGLSLRRIERTPPKAGQVEVAVRAAGLNFRDVLWAMGMLPEEAVEALEERRVALQAAIGRQARMKRTPKLSFVADPAVAHGAAIDEALRRLDGDAR